ncbi:MAG: T9SS type A sorting domain-containing protein [Bacteroidetes bacterium]|nr:T9SS type A sorting domain-containing protein [Bacteroidota bacterium]
MLFKNILSLIPAVFILLGNTISAQVTLTGANTNPVIGETYMLHSADTAGLTEGSAGANITWDFSNITSTATFSYSWVDASTTPKASSFMNADVANLSSGFYDYYSANSTAYSREGVVSATQVVIPYSDPEKILEFPFTYNSTFTDSLRASFFSGVAFERHGIITVTADAHGDLIMPYGTITDVLRIKIVEDYQDDFMGSPLFLYDTEVYMWYKPGTHWPIIALSTIWINGVPTFYASYYDLNISDIEDLTLNNSINVYPNPSNGLINLRINSIFGDIEVIVTDACGKTVFQNVYSDVSRSVQTIDLMGIPSGMYILTLKNEEYTQVKKLMVQ